MVPMLCDRFYAPTETSLSLSLTSPTFLLDFVLHVLYHDRINKSTGYGVEMLSKIPRVTGLSKEEMDSIWDLFTAVSSSNRLVNEYLDQMRIVGHVLEMDNETFEDYTGYSLYSDEDAAEAIKNIYL